MDTLKIGLLNVGFGFIVLNDRTLFGAAQHNVGFYVIFNEISYGCPTQFYFYILCD